MSETPAGLREAIASHLWYHTIEFGRGVVTHGWFDARPIVDDLPWPDVAGKRCLDVGTYDGFLAFELERRGAAEIVAIDIDDHDQWDWPPDVRATGGENLAKLAGPEVRNKPLAQRPAPVDCAAASFFTSAIRLRARRWTTLIHKSIFETVRWTRPFVVPHGVGHPALPRTPRHLARAALQRTVCGRTGVPHAAVLARPRI